VTRRAHARVNIYVCAVRCRPMTVISVQWRLLAPY